MLATLTLPSATAKQYNLVLERTDLQRTAPEALQDYNSHMVKYFQEHCIGRPGRATHCVYHKARLAY